MVRPTGLNIAFIRTLSAGRKTVIKIYISIYCIGVSYADLYVLVFCLLMNYCSSGQIVKNEMDAVCSTYGERKGVYRDLVGKPEGKRALGSPRRRRENNIKMDLQEVGWGAWIVSIWLKIGIGDGFLNMR
jgi:hypothetical protein